ncbi:MAG: hypothetical protein ACHQUC_00115 [Chlamydiales bacterium]
MKSGMHMSQKSIGFQLTGELGALSRVSGQQEQPLFYEIQIFPGESFVTAKVMSEGGNITKPIAVELPLSMRERSYKKVFTRLFQTNVKPSIFLHGHEKLGNRKLHVELDGSSEHSSAHVMILIQGSCREIEYRILLDPLEIGCSRSHIWDKETERYTEASFKLKGIEQLDEKCIHKILLHLNVHNHEVKIEGRTISLTLVASLRQLLHSFSSSKSPISRIEQSKQVQQQDDKETLVFHSFNEEVATSCVALESLKNVLYRFHAMHFQFEMKRARGEKLADSLLCIDPLQWDQLPRMVTVLTNAIQEYANEESDLWLISQQLELLIYLLYAMTVQGIDQHDQIAYEKAYVAISFFSEKSHPLNRYFIIDYLGQFGKQALRLVPDAAFQTKAQGSFWSLLIRLVTEVVDNDWVGEPWQLVSRLNERAEIEELSFLAMGKKGWLVNLCAIQRIVWDHSVQVFLNFIEFIQSNLQVLLSEIDLNHPYFVYGLAALLWRVVNGLEFNELDQTVKQTAVKLLKMISLNNVDGDPSRPFNLGCEQLRHQLLNTMEVFLGCWDNRLRTKILVRNLPTSYKFL